MLSAAFPTTLALDLSDVITLIVFAFFLIGPGLMGIYRWLVKQREKEVAWRERAEGGDTRTRLDEIAAERRQQLQQQAAARQQTRAQAQARTQASPRPGNMSMADRIALARQKAEAQRQGSQPVSRPTPTSHAQQANPQQQAVIEARRRAAQQQALQKQRQQQAALTRKQQQAQAAAQAAAKAQRERAAMQQRQAAEKRQRRPAKRTIQPQTKQAARVVSSDSTETETLRQKLSHRKSLREAIVLREILDRPVSMR